jgi:hypothetical protein
LKKRSNKRQGLSSDARATGVTDMQWRFLKGEPLPKTFEALVLEYDINKTNEQLWTLHRDVVLAEHVKENPGTRPALFWQHDAPRLPVGTFPGAHYDGELPEPRKRLGGTGTPAYECRNVKPSFSLGIPNIWVGIDATDPPTFECQAAYLKRHSLLMAGEEKRADFETETVPKNWDWPI